MSRWTESQRGLSYRIYLSDAMYVLGHNFGLKKRWAEVVGLVKQEENVPPEAIVQAVMLSGGLRFEE